MKRLRQFVHSFQRWAGWALPEWFQVILAISALSFLLCSAFLLFVTLASALHALGMGKPANALLAASIVFALPWGVAVLMHVFEDKP